MMILSQNIPIFKQKACPMNIILLFLLLASSVAFSGASNEDLGKIMTGAVVEQGLNMTPLFALAFCIALFFIFIQKKPQKTIQVCGSLVAIVFAVGLVTWILDFMASHAFVFIMLGIGLVFGCLILFMVFSPPSPPKKQNEYDPQKDKNNPFYEGPR